LAIARTFQAQKAYSGTPEYPKYGFKMRRLHMKKPHWKGIEIKQTTVCYMEIMICK